MADVCDSPVTIAPTNPAYSGNLNFFQNEGATAGSASPAMTPTVSDFIQISDPACQIASCLVIESTATTCSATSTVAAGISVSLSSLNSEVYV